MIKAGFLPKDRKVRDMGKLVKTAMIIHDDEDLGHLLMTTLERGKFTP